MARATLAVAALSLFLPTPVAADGPLYRTRWSFESTHQGVTTHYDVDGYSTVIVPIGSPWSCQKGRVVVGNGGILIGGFTCSDGTGNISVIATCYATKPDAERSHACVDWPQSQRPSLCMTVWCGTAEAAGRGEGI